MTHLSALILFAHGARDPRWAVPFLRLQKMIQDNRPDIRVELAFLELMQPSLTKLVEQLVGDGFQSVTVVPVFLGQGGHVLQDLPALATQIRGAYPTLDFKVANAVGEEESVLMAISEYCLKLV